MPSGTDPESASTIRSGSRLSKFADLDASITDEVVVILEEDVAFFRQAEIFDIGVFAAGDQGVVNICASFVFDDFESIEPVLYHSIGPGNDTSMIPFSNVQRDISRIHSSVGRNKVV